MQRLLLLILLAPVIAQAIVVRHDRSRQPFETLGQKFPSTVMLRHGDGHDGLGGEGTLIAPNWVLTAAHVATDLAPGDWVAVLGKRYPIERIVLYPGWHQDADMPLDIALVRLGAAVSEVPPAHLYTETNELGLVATFVGRGQMGTGLSGPVPKEGIVLGATCRVASTLDVYPGTAARGQYPAEGFQLRFVFHSPKDAEATDLEGISGPGDSGGPAYILKDGTLYVIGVSSGEDTRPAKGKADRYGVFEYYTRVSHFAPWIRTVVGD